MLSIMAKGTEAKSLLVLVLVFLYVLPCAVFGNETDKKVKVPQNGLSDELKLPFIFADHMVFQRDKDITVFGTAKVGQKVSVQLAGSHQATVANSQGKWKVRFNPMKAGGPHTMTVKAEKVITFRDILIGEVWLAAGQSNMEWPLERSTHGREAAAQANDPEIRIINRLGSGKIFGPAWDEATLSRAASKHYYTGTWAVCNPDSVAGFSGVGYFFAKELRDELKVPIGIVSMPIGGTIIEAFISREALMGNKHLQPYANIEKPWYENTLIPSWMRECGKKNLKKWIENPVGSRPGHPYEPTYLFEAGIEPMIPFSIRGVIWYQGESNATVYDQDDAPASQEYCRAGIETLVKDWRDRWGDDFAFYHVQLPNYQKRPWMLFRETQLQTLKTIPNSGLVVSIDLGRPKNIHPKDKFEVGERLSRWALAKTYGKDLVYSGPIFKSLGRDGNELIVGFDHVETGLKTKDGEEVKGFEVADASGHFRPAKVVVHGNRLMVSSAEVGLPVFVRYAWAANPICNLVNGANLPASPFRAKVQR